MTDGSQELDDRLSEPTAEVVATIGRTTGDFVVLGVGGKSPTLAPDVAVLRRRPVCVA